MNSKFELLEMVMLFVSMGFMGIGVDRIQSHLFSIDAVLGGVSMISVGVVLSYVVAINKASSTYT